MENKWTHVSGFQYAGQWFSVWVQPVRNTDGTFRMASKVEETTPEEMDEFEKEHGIKQALHRKVEDE